VATLGAAVVVLAGAIIGALSSDVFVSFDPIILRSL
jgi:hypothetical protein